jgi:hypothetical protein
MWKVFIGVAFVGALAACTKKDDSPPAQVDQVIAQPTACELVGRIGTAIEKARKGEALTDTQLGALEQEVNAWMPKDDDDLLSGARLGYLAGSMASDTEATCDALQAAVQEAEMKFSSIAGDRGGSAVSRAAEAGFLDHHLEELKRASAFAGYTPEDRELLVALRERDVENAKRALANGATANVRMLDGRSAAVAAMELERDLALTILLKKGLDPNLETAGEPVLHRVLRVELPKRKRLEVVAALLEGGAAIEGKGERGASPLMVACLMDHVEIAKTLIAAGADVNARDEDGRSVITYAQRALNPKPLQRLLTAKGAAAPSVAKQPAPSTPSLAPLPTSGTISESLAFIGGSAVYRFQTAGGTALYRPRNGPWYAFETERGPETAVKVSSSATGFASNDPVINGPIIAWSSGQQDKHSNDWAAGSGVVEILEGTGGLWRRTAAVKFKKAIPKSLSVRIADNKVYVLHQESAGAKPKVSKLAVLTKNARGWRVETTVTLPVDQYPRLTGSGLFAFVESGGDQKAVLHLYELQGRAWKRVAMLEAPKSGYTDFGEAVFVANDRLIVGAAGEHRTAQRDPDAFGHGAIYVYERQGGEWTLSTKVYPDDITQHHRLHPVAAVGDRIYASAPGSQEAGLATGSVYVFEFRDGAWKQLGKLMLATPHHSDNFALSSQFDGRWLYLSRVSDDDYEWFRLEVAR